MLKPTSGVATVAGYDVLTQPAEVRARIGFMSGNTGIYDRMTAWELVEYFGRLYGMEEPRLSQRRLDEIFTTLQMNEFRDVLGSKMSTGMKQKVSIARTIIHDPPVLIFDEPTTGLDVLVARAVLNAIDSLRDQGKCIIFSTHIMREVEKLCDRVAIIHKGRILAAGTPPELLERFGKVRLRGIILRPDLAGRGKAGGGPMNRRNVRLVFHREVRDQIRDRRTLFMVVVLPLLLYPGLAIGMVQISLLFREQPRTVVVLGTANLPSRPAPFERTIRASPAVVRDPRRRRQARAWFTTASPAPGREASGPDKADIDASASVLEEARQLAAKSQALEELEQAARQPAARR